MSADRYRIVARIVTGTAALLAAFEAHAHAVTPGANAFLAGLGHPVTALEHLLPLIALGMLAGRRDLAAGQGLLVAFPVAFATGALAGSALAAAPELSAVNAATALVAGGLVALALALPRSLLYVIVVAIGAIHGLSHGSAMGQVMPAFIAGAALAATLVFAYAFGVTHHALKRASRWLPVTVRAIGSWIAAFGILTLALAAMPSSLSAVEVASIAMGG